MTRLPTLLLRLAATLVAVLGTSLPRHAQEGQAPTDGTLMLPLRSGDIVFGSILDHDPDGLRFRRLDNGGVVPLPWDVLDPETAGAMRLRFGYVEAEAEALLVDAYRVPLANGLEVVGAISDLAQDPLQVKRAEGTLPIQKSLVRGAITTVRAPALEVYTKEELFRIKSFELQGVLARDGRAGALAHDQLAKYAERLLDYPHALEHYRKALELDPTFDPARLTSAIERATVRAEQQEQIDVLSDIERLAARRNYGGALAQLEAFPRTYPDSALLEDWNELRARVGKMQERDAREEVVARWHYWTQRLARDAGRMESYEEALAYLDEKMGQAIVEKVRDDMQSIVPGIEVDQVRRLWDERPKGRFRQASYGQGTWLLGDGALTELGKEPEPEAPEDPDSRDSSRQRIKERVARYLENQKLAQSATQEGGSDDDPQTFWETWPSSARGQWILAYHAEKSGDFRDLQERRSPCRECGGKGARELLFTGSSIAGSASGEVLVPCPSCHTYGVVRRIRYR